MKTFNYFTLITLATLSVACNEKISPKLLDANQSTTVPPVIEPEVYHFGVKNISPVNRKFHLHKTGPGNYDTPCEIKSLNKFSSNEYRDIAKKHEYDISCFFEAEELALAQQGFSIQFEASPNTCEYVGYAPFSFFNYQPGDSTATYLKVKCEGASATYGADSAGNPLGCGQMMLEDDDANKHVFKAPPSEDHLCRYNYSYRSTNPGPDCDIGTVYIRDITVTPGDEGAINIEVADEARPIKCGGQIAACVSGPIKTEEEADTSTVVLYETEKNKAFQEKREYEKSPKGFGTLYYANYRRNLANPNIAYGAQPKDQGPFAAYAANFNTMLGNPLDMRTFYPLLMENYAAAFSYSGQGPLMNPLDPSQAISFNDDITIGGRITQKGTSLAAEPFIGGKIPGTDIELRTNPFYTFYCLDSAYEIRARIKMVVRDWDRHFPTDRTHFELLTDVFQGTTARMDNPFAKERDGDGDRLNDINDISDWDDFLPMQTRDNTELLDPHLTPWGPVNGFNNPKNFPQIKVE